MDNELNNQALSLLYFAPIIFLLKCYWLLGNRQMFFNELIPISDASTVINPGHSLFDFVSGMNPSLFILVFIPVFVFTDKFETGMHIVTGLLRKQRKVKGFNSNMTDITVKLKENLDSYWNCIPGII